MLVGLITNAVHQLAVLIETMRREGYEFAVSRPEIIVREVARAHGGEATALEGQDGVGARFRLRLDLGPHNPPSSPMDGSREAG